MTVKYRVHLLESERGWGSERWTEDYDTRVEAEKRIFDVNKENTAARAPDYYVVANREIELVEVE